MKERDLKLHKFIVNIPLLTKCSLTKKELCMPTKYVFNGMQKSYVIENNGDFFEFCDLFVDSDEKLIKEPIMITNIPCGFVSFYEAN